ncbi:Argininosuccinate lyase (plasmid) [Variovorax sp. SRS16]|uniref:Bug family tripartite tricarboxylate transporter substrate binding protein n=1 Tax=Variovorax sp. SRS16 TaxID=282217 RepID=UPI0013163E43|nr:tripartite tricarboxylate transporter substrate binding protein [Variovorax sp. SRS16]VTU46733.1 Argininosuccinate lyase [Variovorax sp. SRS16]
MKLTMKAALSLLLAAAASLALAQSAYPTRPIKIVVGFAPGGGGDGVARLMAEHMSRTLKQPVLVENRPGAGTTIAPAYVAAAAPDGYTLVLAPDSVFGGDKALYRPNVKYDETNFTPISRWASTFFVMAVNKDFGVTGMAELIAKVKQNNNELFVASTQGIYPALIMTDFNKMTGVNLKQVPYKGGAPAVMAVLGGEVPVTFAVPSSVMPMVQEGKLRAIGITADKRSGLAPDIPTLAEQGLPGFNVSYWFGLAGPAGMSADIVQKLFDASSAALADPAVRANLAKLGYEPAPSKSVAEFRQTVEHDGSVLRKVVESTGLKGE